jgi:hypothetical protein
VPTISRRRPRCLLVAALGITIPLALSGCSSNPSAAPATTTTSPPTSSSTAPAPTTTTTAPAPPCTEAAISAGITATPNEGLISVNGYGCSGPWAWAGVTLQPGEDAVLVLSASGSSWQIADRATACSQHLVPADIYTAACTTS